MTLKLEDIDFSINKDKLFLDFSDNDYNNLNLLTNFSDKIFILDTSNNKIDNLEFLSNFINIKELYLTNNLITDDQIIYLKNWKNWKIIFLFNNKFQNYESIKLKIITMLPDISIIDGKGISRLIDTDYSFQDNSKLNEPDINTLQYNGYETVDRNKIKKILNHIESWKFKDKWIIKNFVKSEIGDRINK